LGGNGGDDVRDPPCEVLDGRLEVSVFRPSAC
jgi:hypothetical protein